jgi:hypothetical protein
MILGVNRNFPGPWTCELTKTGIQIRDRRGVAVAFVRAYPSHISAKSNGRLLSPMEAKALAFAISQAPVLWRWLRAHRTRGREIESYLRRKWRPV